MFNISVTDRSIRQPKRAATWTAMILLGGSFFLLLSAGCSKEKFKEALQDVQAKTKSLTSSKVQPTDEIPPQRGSATLDTEPPTSPIEQLELELIVIGDGRPNVVKIVSYDARRRGRNFPAVMLHGTTEISDASSLPGETIDCDVYYQATADSLIAMTQPGNSASVTFESFGTNDQALNATMGPVELLRSDDQPISIRGGEMVAVVRRKGD